MSNGSLCVYRVDNITGTLVKIIKSNEIKDSHGIPLSQSIKAIAVSETMPPKFDCDGTMYDIIPKIKRNAKPVFEDQSNQGTTVGKKYKPLLFTQSSQASIATDPSLIHDDSFLVLGMSKGNVIFLEFPVLNLIYSRFSIERKEAVRQIF